MLGSNSGTNLQISDSSDANQLASSSYNRIAELNEDSVRNEPETENLQQSSNRVSITSSDPNIPTSKYGRSGQSLNANIDKSAEFSIKYNELLEASIPKEMCNENISILKSNGYRRILCSIDCKDFLIDLPNKLEFFLHFDFLEANQIKGMKLAKFEGFNLSEF